jgi:hypothetical protein
MREFDEETTVPTTPQEDSAMNEMLQAGPLWDRFQIFLEFTDEPITFDEWLDR